MKVFEVNGSTLCLALFVDVTNSNCYGVRRGS
ncbi:unnamed protein product [Coffea canephora]|uniref:Uncharacterized protein n=1 Tax=Coffea canephora TaxID=49390 RepID=A0A068TMI2_COFCA|nr:unnamed protein product [Coffea canephora]